MKAKRQNRATSVSATMLDGTGGHVTPMQSQAFPLAHRALSLLGCKSMRNW
jgi:hypothetical protein